MMARSVFRSYPKAAEFDIQAIANAVSANNGLFCLSPATWELAYNLVLTYGDWRSRYYFTDESGNQLTITDAEYDQITDLYLTAVEELQMPCDLGEAITLLGQMISDLATLTVQVNMGSGGSDCGCPPGGIGENPPPSEPDQNPPGGEDPPPVGFDTWEDFLDYKCRAANKIVDDLIASTGNLGSLSGVIGAIQGVLLASFLSTSLLGGVMAGVMALGFSSFAAAGIIIAALVILILASVGGLVWFSTLAANMEDNKSDLICALYAATTTDDAMASWSAFVTARIGDASGEWSGEPEAGLISSTMETVLDALNNLTVINLLFTPNEEIAVYEASFDCSTCSPSECPWEMVNGTGTFRYDGISFVLSSEDLGGGVHFMFAQTEVECTELNWCTIFTARSSMNNGAANYTRELYSSANTVHNYNQEQFDFNHDPTDAFWDLDIEYPISAFIIASDSSFTVTLKLIQTVEATDFDPSASPACD
jgi:hypothetical protein